MSKPKSKLEARNIRAWDTFTPGQKRLVRKHGSPAVFAAACYAACPACISMDEAQAAVEKYTKEFTAA